MTYKADQEKKNKLLTIAAVVVLILAVLPIVAFAVFSVVDFKPVPTNKSTVEEPTLSRSEQRKKERE
jgi:flagellar basal body-associated protein FliL